MRRKFLASILAFCMVLTLFPMTAFAASVPTDTKDITSTGTWSDKIYSVVLDEEKDATAITELVKLSDGATSQVLDSAGEIATNPTVNYDSTTKKLTVTFSDAALTAEGTYYIAITKSETTTHVKVTVPAYTAPTATVAVGTIDANGLAFEATKVPVKVTIDAGNAALTGDVSVTGKATIAAKEVTLTGTKAYAKGELAFELSAQGSAKLDAAGDWNLEITEVTVGGVTIAKDKVTATSLTFKVAAKEAEKGTQTLAFATAGPIEKTFGDAAFTNAATVKEQQGGTVSYASSNTGVATVTSSGEVTIIGAGETVITATAAETDDYSEATATYTLKVAKQKIVLASATVSAKKYDGTPDATVSAATFKTVVTDGEGSTVSLSKDANGYRVVSATFASPNASQSEQDVTVEVALQGTAAKNYELTTDTVTAKGTINKISSLPLTATKMVSTAQNAATPTPIALSSMSGYPASPLAFGNTPTFTLADNALDSAKGVSNAVVSGGNLTLTLKDATELAKISDNATDAFALTSTDATNYETVTINVTVTYTTKPVITISGATAATNLSYNGEAQKGYDDSALAVSENSVNITKANVTASYEGVDGTSYGPSATAPTNAGKYKVTLDVPASADQYKSEPLVLNFTIAQATPIFTAPTCSALTEAALLSTSDLTGGEVKGVDNTAIDGTFAWSDGSVTVVQGTAYTWIFTPGAANANYDFTAVTGTLTPWASSGGGDRPTGGGGTTTPPTDPTDPTPPPSTGEDVTQTVTPDVSDGTASATVDKDTADKLVSDAVDNKSENVTVKVDVPAGSDVNEVKADIPASAVADLASKTNANLVVDTPVGNVTLPKETLSQLGGASGNVTVTAAVNEDNSVKVEVQANGSTVGSLNGGMKVDLPVSQPTAGTVAVLVDENGNETILPKSSLDGSEMAMLLETGSATIKFVDNAQSFADTAGHWAQNSIAFVSSRNLFQGMEENNFKADVPMNRAMLVTVLHRLESTPDAAGSSFEDVPSDSYYATAAAWAAGKGIVTGDASGFSGDRNVTREEMAVMLYRYVQTINGNKGSLGSFSGMGGASDVSGWATEAMRWAVGSGIIGGDNNGNLNPGSTATRGEVSQMLMNFVKVITK